MTPMDYDYLRKLLKERSGLVLSADKQYLIESRLLPIARKIEVPNLSDLVIKLKAPGAAAHAGICSAVLPLDQIAPKVVRLFAGERP